MSGMLIGDMELGHTVHPDIKKYHKSYSTSSKDLRDARANGRQACAVCSMVSGSDNEHRRCGKCKHASYCSKECQRKDWPTHKTACSPNDSGINMMKVAQTLDASTFINMQLQACFILAFDLLRQPRLDRPFAARIDIGIEPTDLMQFMGIYSGRSTDDVPGMIQVNAFTPLPEAFITEQSMLVWRRAREGMTAADFAASPVGLLVLSKSNALVNIFPIVVYPPTMQLVRDGGFNFTRASSLTGITTIEPVSIDGLLEILNKHIRADDKNRLSLRTKMTSADVQVIRDAAAGKVLATRAADWPMVAPSPLLAATILREKMKRESMYQVTFTFK